MSFWSGSRVGLLMRSAGSPGSPMIFQVNRQQRLSGN